MRLQSMRTARNSFGVSGTRSTSTPRRLTHNANPRQSVIASRLSSLRGKGTIRCATRRLQSPSGRGSVGVRDRQARLSYSRVLTVVRKAKRGIIRPYLNTMNIIREVDLCPSLPAMLKEYVSLRPSGLLFRTSIGPNSPQPITLQDSLHPMLEEMKHVNRGFVIFGRFRVTHLEKSDCPRALKHPWSEHAPAHVSERYVKLLNDRAYRSDWAERVGTGFVLSVGQPGQVHLAGKNCLG